MKSLFLDSNIWLRLFLKDEPRQYEEVIKLFKLIDSGRFRPFTSSLVFLEIYFVLRSFYRLTDEKVKLYFENIKKTRGLVVLDKTDLDLALSFFYRTKIKFSDCLLASQLPAKTAIVTYDRDFKKMKEMESCTPVEVLNLTRN